MDSLELIQSLPANEIVCNETALARFGDIEVSCIQTWLLSALIVTRVIQIVNRQFWNFVKSGMAHDHILQTNDYRYYPSYRLCGCATFLCGCLKKLSISSSNWAMIDPILNLSLESPISNFNIIFKFHLSWGTQR